MIDRQRVELLVAVARRYWIDRADQGTIAEEIGYSRSMVSRLLDEARREGVVTFSVGHPLERAFEAERGLVRAFGLASARVCLADPGVSAVETIRLGAQVVDGLLEPDSVLSVTNGRTVSEIAGALSRGRHPHMTVVQALGVIAHDNHLIDSPQICGRFADALGSPYQTLPAPLVVSSRQMARALRREGRVAMPLAMASHADVLITGIGATTPTGDGAIFDGYIAADEHRDLLIAGAVGHIVGHHIDASGRHVDLDFCQRLIAVPFDRLEAIPNVVAVAWGEEKIPAITASLRSGIVDHFVTDLATANRLLLHRPEDSGPPPPPTDPDDTRSALAGARPGALTAGRTGTRRAGGSA
ncbi:sugar-binding protein [Actinomyces sp. B33]|uniref:sugar-binding transcriptional regulator n=1 Tax=Actinomyces sp. B33 TaxID=2942131 RepID=UPI00234014D8|nr:sugar-binding domain-containing protein [Actinomyces sp. B33]MDC4232884.1 sugar-binding protein [Actinomyces sp. B33]